MPRIYDTLSRSYRELTRDPDDSFRMYVCGVTVYDRVHIGHARSALVFDALVRYLEGQGFRVRYVRNFTDVDDKIIERARQNGEEPLALSARMIEAFREDMGALGLRTPDVEPKVSEHIPQIIDLVRALMDRGHAYTVDGDVYFSVASWPEYGCLSGRDVDEQREGARVEVDQRKRHPFDFALWKSARPGEPQWESPWGPGRPGWHIECSAMSAHYLGEQFHLHGGGEDLIFPHHENELAQSRAGTDGSFADLWMHNGMITTDGEKMSKSLGNFWTLADVLAKQDGEVIRMFALSKHYRKPVDYNEKSLHDAQEGLRRLYRALDHMDGVAQEGLESVGEHPTPPQEAESAVEAFVERASRFLAEDFNTGGAIGACFEFAKEQCRRLETLDDSESTQRVAARSSAELRRIAGWLGMLGRDLAAFEAAVQKKKQAELQVDGAQVELLIAQRTDARARKDWSEADRIRGELDALGVELKDGAEGTTWSLR